MAPHHHPLLFHLYFRHFHADRVNPVFPAAYKTFEPKEKKFTQKDNYLPLLLYCQFLLCSQVSHCFPDFPNPLSDQQHRLILFLPVKKRFNIWKTVIFTTQCFHLLFLLQFHFLLSALSCQFFPEINKFIQNLGCIPISRSSSKIFFFFFFYIYTKWLSEPIGQIHA